MKEQNTSSGDKSGDNNNFCEQFNRMEELLDKDPEEEHKKNKSNNLPYMFDDFNSELQNHTYYGGKPIVVQQQNRVAKQKQQKPVNVRRRDLPDEEAKVVE